MPTTLPVVVDRASPVPLYHQLAEQWAGAIRSGTLKPGDPFENELALVARLRLSRPTIRKAMDELVHQGLLVRRRGVGTHVASQVTHRPPTLASLFEDLQSSGHQPRTEVLRLQASRPNARVARAMGLDETTPLVYLERLRYADGFPLVLLRSWLPPRHADLTAQECTARGLRQILTERGDVITVAHQRAQARVARTRERRLLDLTRSGAVLDVVWQGFDAQGSTVEYGEHTYRGDVWVLDDVIHG